MFIKLVKLSIYVNKTTLISFQKNHFDTHGDTESKSNLNSKK